MAPLDYGFHGHLLHDQATRQLFAGPYTDGEDDATPSKEPRRDPLSPNSFNDDPGALAPPKPMPTKPTPRGIERPDVPMLMQPQSLQVTRQPPMPGLEMPAEFLPGENGRPPSMGMPPPMPGMMPPPAMPRMAPPAMPRSPQRNNAPPSPGLKGPPKTPSLKAPKPVSQSPAQKPPHQQSKPPSKSPPSKPSGDSAPKSKSRLSDLDFLNTTSDEDQPGGMPSAPPMSMAPPMPPTPAPMQQQGLPSVGDFDSSPDWGSGDGSNHRG